MDLVSFEKLMAKHGAVIRAIPKEVTSIFETRHKSHYPNGEIIYLEKFKRKMIVVKTVPKDAGKFLLKTQNDLNSTVKFDGKSCFDSLQDIVEYLSLV